MRCYCDWADRDWTLFAYHLLNQHSFLIQVPDGTPNPVNVVREVIGQAMKAGEIPRRNADLAAAAAIGVVMQPATYKVYGRFSGPLSAHVRFFADAAWAVLSEKRMITEGALKNRQRCDGARTIQRPGSRYPTQHRRI